MYVTLEKEAEYDRHISFLKRSETICSVAVSIPQASSVSVATKLHVYGYPYTNIGFEFHIRSIYTVSKHSVQHSVPEGFKCMPNAVVYKTFNHNYHSLIYSHITLCGKAHREILWYFIKIIN